MAYAMTFSFDTFDPRLSVGATSDRNLVVVLSLFGRRTENLLQYQAPLGTLES
jgi:hypothetical protein